LKAKGTIEEDAVGDDGVVLSDRERQALAGLAEQIGDPWLARQLGGQETPPSDEKRNSAGQLLHRFSAALAPASGWVGIALVLAGAALAIATFTLSTVVASFGLLLMGAGAWRLVVDRSDVILRRLAERRAPVSVPPPPRTPPAAV
jgi:hypothetical protein